VNVCVYIYMHVHVYFTSKCMCKSLITHEVEWYIISVVCVIVLSSDRQTDKVTDRQTDFVCLSVCLSDDNFRKP